MFTSAMRRSGMGYPEMMRDIMEQVRREEIKNMRQELDNTGIAQYDDHEHAEELIKSANDALCEAVKSDRQRKN